MISSLFIALLNVVFMPFGGGFPKPGELDPPEGD